MLCLIQFGVRYYEELQAVALLLEVHLIRGLNFNFIIVERHQRQGFSLLWVGVFFIPWLEIYDVSLVVVSGLKVSFEVVVIQGVRFED